MGNRRRPPPRVMIPLRSDAVAARSERERLAQTAVPPGRGGLGAQAGRRPPASVTDEGAQVGEAARSPNDHPKRPVDLPSRVSVPLGVLNEPYETGDTEKSSRCSLAEDLCDFLSDGSIYRLGHVMRLLGSHARSWRRSAS